MVTPSHLTRDARPDTPANTGLRDQATFICGHPKSGTSLVMTLLDSHPQLIVYPEETGYFRRFLPEVQAFPDRDPMALAEERILGIFRWDTDNPHPSQVGFLDRDYSDIDYERVRQQYREIVTGGGPSSRAILPAAILAYGQVSGVRRPEAKRWVEKTPYNEHFADRIFELWPAAKCLHIVRDPRDNFASYRRKHPEWSVWSFAGSWKRSLDAGLRNQRQFGSDRYLILRYETLVARTDEAIAELVDFLEIENSPTLRSPTRAGKSWGGNSMFDQRLEGISSEPLGRYRQHLGTQAVRSLEWLLGPQMLKFGYALENASLPERALGWVVRGMWLLRSEVVSIGDEADD